MRNSLIVNQKSAAQQPFEIICLVNYAQVKKNNVCTFILQGVLWKFLQERDGGTE